MKYTNKLNYLLGFVFLSLNLPFSYAGTLTGNLTVQAQVADTCSLNTVNIDFGVVTLTSGQPGSKQATGQIKVNCTKDTVYTIKLGTGTAGVNPDDRSMGIDGSPDRVKYNLYNSKDPNTIWGDGTESTRTFQNTSTGIEDVEIINAYIPYNQTAKAGLYTDTIIITVDY